MFRNRQIVPVIFFILVAGYLTLIGHVYLSQVHYESDAVLSRDTWTMWNYRLSTDTPVRSLFVAAMAHNDGPLPYIFGNLYCLLVGNVLPLTPSTLQFPNTIFAVLTCLVIFFLCQRVVSAAAGYFAVLAFALAPWLAFTIRQPWHFDIMSCLLHALIFSCYLGHVSNLQSRFYRIAAPLSLTMYGMISQDWPSFLMCLAVFCWLSLGRRITEVLRNPFNVVPALYVVLEVAWAVVMTMRFGSVGLPLARIPAPFFKANMASSGNNLQHLVDYTLLAWGPQLLLAIAGVWLHLRYGRQKADVIVHPAQSRLEPAERVQPVSSSVSRSFWDAMCLWLIFGGVGLAVSSGSPSYLYVVAFPSAMLAGMAIARIRSALAVVAVIVVLVGFQASYMRSERFGFQTDERARLLAAACFVITQRPDLRSGTRTPVVSQGDGSAIGQYIRGGRKTVLIPEDVATRYGVLDPGSVPHPFRLFLETSDKDGQIINPWIILATDVLGPAGSSDRAPDRSLDDRSRQFFLRLLDDPDISWFAAFRDPNGEAVYLGDFTPGTSRPASQAPLMDVPALSRRYLADYDRIRFLSQNAQYLKHF